MIKCAVVQNNPILGEKQKNLNETITHMRGCAKSGAKLVIFPECNLSGYLFNSKEECLSIAETIPGPTIETLMDKCKELGIYIIVGLLEKHEGKLYNSAVLIGDNGEVLYTYRKTHLPDMGADRFVDPGPGPLEVVETPIGKIGILICYDWSIVETTRVLMLKGAGILVAITNMPDGRDAYPDFISRTRARDNHSYVVVSNRVGEEGGVRFLGRSQICDPYGAVLAEAPANQLNVIYSDLEPDLVNKMERKHKSGGGQPDYLRERLLRNRRPDLYALIALTLDGEE